MSLRIEPRCRRCGHPKLGHTISLTCPAGTLDNWRGVGYLETRYEAEDRMSKDEGLNPSIGCGFSRPHEPEHENHAPIGFNDPLRPEKEMVDISAPVVR